MLGPTRLIRQLKGRGVLMRKFALALLIVAACGSESVFDERFAESGLLQGPTINVSPADPDKFTFSMVGDLHVGGGTERFRDILNRASTSQSEFIVLLGDIVDQGKEDDVEAVHAALVDQGFDQKYLPVIGNHDVFYSGWNFYRTRFGASHYTVDIGNCRFIVLDTADGVVGEDQVAWLEAQLQRPTDKNLFILSHYLPVIPGQRTYLRLSNQNEAERLMAMASRYGVKGWFGGHYHSYIKETIGGVTYVVAGGGGGRRMAPVFSYFYVDVRIDGKAVDFQFRAVP